MLWHKSWRITPHVWLAYRIERGPTWQTYTYKPGKSLREEVYPLTFSELLAYITGTRRSDGLTDFRLAVLVNLFKHRLEQLGLGAPDVNSTRLKEQILAKMLEMEAFKNGRDVTIAFRKDIGPALSQACRNSEAIILARAAQVLRRHMLDHKSTFDGTFQEGCIQDAIPPTLLQFVGMIEHGADIKSQLRLVASKSDLAMAQLLQYNCYARYKEGAATHKQSKARETSFPLYMGMSVFAKTRKKQLVEMLHDHDISISYDRVLEDSAQLRDAAVAKYVEDGVVCPPDLRRGLFTTAAMDNIDHNSTATTSTSISMFQHPTTGDRSPGQPFPGEKQGPPHTGHKGHCPPKWSWTDSHPLWKGKNPLWRMYPLSRKLRELEVLRPNQKEQNGLLSTSTSSCRWKTEGFEGRLSPLLKALHIMPEQRIQPTGVFPAW